ncbi:ATP-binding protein [Sphingosinicella sp. LHD-64]|uniref:ATP-binding protein n=1 Tax=Sphingosinicella sp. LHD-64 TaxID=3072139 RepID=UPI00280C5FFE|nr:ATP-binding protein [Sphingosinicella sp. LHD-64]MDQ8758024.1 ATP-binding protein [Sphingosinicella sp. LHD-64]
MTGTRLFDLNIERILEAWTNAHAVRELIANALDEQTLSRSAEIDILRRSDGAWVIQDHGRGLRYEHFTQNESAEKLENVGKVIGKFGVGLKDALATLHRNGVRVEIESAHGSITVVEKAKHGFDDVVTLHAEVGPSARPDYVGTKITLAGLRDSEMDEAKRFFLKFSGEMVLEETSVGQILGRKDGQSARVYVAGLLIAEEEAFAFSYNITSLNVAMRKALNRERTNVGRTAYTERVKHMLLQAKGAAVAATLADELVKVQAGTGADEVQWKEVAVHACKILNASGRYLFVTAFQLVTNVDAIDKARDDGLAIVTIPDNIHADVAGGIDALGAPIRDLGAYQAEWNDSFVFDFVDTAALTKDERRVFEMRDSIAQIAGGFPRHVKGVRISRTMRADFVTGTDSVGLWDPESSCIVIRRDQLIDLRNFAGTLLHEIVHAATGFVDVSRDFENALTDVMGAAAAQACTNAPTPNENSIVDWLFRRT